MRHAAGQGMRHAGRLLRLFMRVGVAVLVLAAAGLGALTWRLSRGPLELPWLIPTLESLAAESGYHLRVAAVALTWEGEGERVDRPIDLRLSGLVLADAAGAPVLQVPAAEVSLSFLALLQGELRPRALDIDGLRLRAWRRADGSAGLDLAPPDAKPAAPDAAKPDAGKPDAAGPDAASDTEAAAALLREALAELARPAGRLHAGPSMLAALRRARLRNAEIWLVDRQLDTTWHARRVTLDLQRHAAGGADASAEIVLDLAHASLRFTASAHLPASHGDAVPPVAFTATLPPLVPAELARDIPRLAPLAALDAAIAFTVAGALPADLGRPQLRIDASIGPGTLHLARGDMPLQGARLSGQGTPDEFDLRLLSLDVAPPGANGGPPGPTTRITGWLHATRNAGGLDAALSLALDRVSFADLPALWPVGLGGPGTRPWITQNITAGTVTGLTLALALHAAPDLSDARITWIHGAAAGHDLTVHWLRPVPPIEHGEASLSIDDADSLRIEVLSGQQAPVDPKAPPLALTGGSVVLSGLSGNRQFADIDGELAGPLPTLLGLLRHPRIRLLDRRPIPLRDPAGQLTGRFSVSHLPLRDDLDMDQVHIQAGAHLTGVHLGGIAAGHDLSRGTLDLEAGNDGLSVRGKAEIAAIPAELLVEMDFRGGPPGQVIQKVVLDAHPQFGQLAPLGIEVPSLLTGALGVHAEMTSRRDGNDTIGLALDLTPAAIDLARLAWAKPVGRAAHAVATIQLRQQRVTAIEGLRVEGPGIDARGTLGFAAGRPQRLSLQRLALGPPAGAPATDLEGSVTWPSRVGGPWIVSLAGRQLDASAEFTRAPGAAPAKPQPKPGPKVTAEPPPGPPWQLEARIAKVLTGEGQALADVAVRAENDGRVIRSATVSGRTVAAPPGALQAGAPQPGPFHFGITAGAGVRGLTGSAEDAGGLLRALGVLPDMYGGEMTLTGRYDDGTPEHALRGDVRITNFRLRNAPVMARLLQALSVYGIVTALESPDLGFNELVASFRLAGGTLELSQARAYNASLGMTAKGSLDLDRQSAEVEGTIVPAYFLNSLLGKVPLIGGLLSPERGGGLIALAYTVRGPFADPTVRVNPLSAVTPGFLRGLFDIFGPSGDPAAPGTVTPAPTPPAVPRATPVAPPTAPPSGPSAAPAPSRPDRPDG